MRTKLIPIKIDEPSVYRNFSNDKLIEKLEFELDYKNYISEVVIKNQYVRGVVCLHTLNGERITFLKNDMVYFIDEEKEICERERTEKELIDDKIYGVFEYTKSLAAIEVYFFNQNIILYKKHRSKLHKLVSDLIISKLAQNNLSK